MDSKKLLLMFVFQIAIQLVLSAELRSAECPENLEEWTRFRNTLVDKVKGGKGIGDAYQYKKMVLCLNVSETKSFSKDVRSCFKKVDEFLGAFSRDKSSDFFTSGRGYGFKMSDREYLKHLDDEKLAEVPRDLWAGVGLGLKNSGSVENSIALLKKKFPEWKIVRFDSKHLTSIDQPRSNGRLLIMIPGERLDRWIQIVIPETDNQSKSSEDYQQLSVVTVEKKDRENKKVRPPRVWFRDYFRDTRKQQLIERPEAENCLKCHFNGVNSIVPKNGSLKPSDRFMLDGLNQKIESYGALSFDHLIDSSKLGPQFGPEDNPARTDAFFKACAPDLSVQSISRIRDNMNCAFCHAGKRGEAGVLRYPIGTAEAVGILESHVVDAKRMPPFEVMSQKERKALVDCLKLEYYGSPKGAKVVIPGILEAYLKNGAEQCGPRTPESVRKDDVENSVSAE